MNIRAIVFWLKNAYSSIICVMCSVYFSVFFLSFLLCTSPPHCKRLGQVNTIKWNISAKWKLLFLIVLVVSKIILNETQVTSKKPQLNTPQQTPSAIINKTTPQNIWVSKSVPLSWDKEKRKFLRGLGIVITCIMIFELNKSPKDLSKVKKLCDVRLAVGHSWQVYCRLKFCFIFLCGISNTV